MDTGDSTSAVGSVVRGIFDCLAALGGPSRPATTFVVPSFCKGDQVRLQSVRRREPARTDHQRWRQKSNDCGGILAKSQVSESSDLP
jgi:hypothetical protein